MSTQAGRDLLADVRRDLRLPIVVAPMFLISGPDMVIAAGQAGVLCALPAPNARTIEVLADWLAQIDAAFAALGSPARVTEQVHAYGGAVFADVISVAQARKAIAGGADGLILVTARAGGHTGTLNPFAFVDEVRQFWDGPIALAGGIATGRAIRAAEAAGADLAYIGTHFIAAQESLVSDENRQLLGQCSSADVVTTDAVSGVPANWLRPSLEKAQLDSREGKPVAAPDFSNLHSSSKAWKDIWGAGHGVGQTPGARPLAAIVEDLAQQYAAAGAVSRSA